MTHSFSQTVSLTCPDCGQSFTADIWLVVDASERPDLIGRIHAGTLHDLPCPHCGHNGKVDAPILLYRPGATPPLLFSPARRTTAEQDREQAGGLLGYLHHALGAAWRDEWLAAMPIIPRHFLPAALSDDPKAALRQAAEEAMHPVLREVLAELAQSGVTINSQEELERALAARPDLQAKLAAAQSGGLTVPPQFQADIRQAQTGEQRYLQRGDRRGLDEAAAAWERIMNHPTFPQSDDRFQLAACNNGGGVFLRRYRAQGQIADLHRALDLWQTAVQRTPPDSPDLPGYLNNLGTGLSDRYARTGQLADLEEAIRVYQTAVQRTPPDSPDLPGYLNNLGTGLRDRYARTGQLADLEEAIRVYQTAVQRTPPDSPDLPSLLNNLGTGLRDRYARTGQLADLKEAIRVYQTAVQRTPPDSPDLPGRLNNLGNGHRDRYARTGQLADLEEAIRVTQTAVQRTPPDSPDLPSLLNNLGNGLRARYARTGQLADLEEAIRVYQTAVQRTPPDSPDLPGYLNNLGTGLSDRYARTGQLADLEEAIRVYQTAVQRTPPDSPDLPGYLNNLGTGLRDRYARTGQLADLEEAIRVYQTAVQRTPPDSPDLPSLLNNLGNGLSDRYARTGQLADLEEAIRVYQTAVQRTPPDSPALPGYLNNLGNGLRARYARTGQLADLEEAIRVYQTAVQRTPPDSPDLPSRLNNLGNGLRYRYARTGQLADLEEAIRVYQTAVQRTPPDSPALPGYLNNLGTGLSDRYARTGQLADLEEAIRVYQTAVQRTPPDSPDLPSLLNNLGNGLSDRYARTGQLADLEEAIRVYQTAVQRTPPDSPDLPSLLNNLGSGLRDRYARTGQLADLEEAIRVYQTAVQRTPPDSPDLPGYLNNLGTGLRDRYARTGQLADLEEAIRVYQTAVQRTPPDSPDLPSLLNNLGNGLSARYARTGQLADLEEAIRVYDQALRYLDAQFLISPVSFQLGQQRNWAGLFARAVTAYGEAGQPQLALAVAEGSKSRLLTSLLGRGYLPAPLAIPPALAQQEQTSAAALNALDAAALAQHGLSGQHKTDGALAQRQALVGQLQQAWQQMAAYGPEAQEYVTLRRGDRPTWDDLSRLAQRLPPHTAALSLFTTSDQILLFLLHADATLHSFTAPLSLDDFRYLYRNNYVDEVLNRETHRQTGRPFSHRWRELGQPLLAPLLPHLANIQHLILVPEGALHLLPLHALTLDEQGRTLLDDFTISYIPALSLLDRLLRRPPLTDGETVVLGYTHADPKTERGAQERAIFLGEAVQAGQQLGVPPLLDAAASSQNLHTRVAGQTLRLLHLSCHGTYDGADPLRSGVLLADGLFTARDFMTLRFQADLVTLSACQTGISDSLGGDEMAGLSQALLHAGASSLLMGLWSVNAFTTAALMADLYRRLWGPDGRKQMGEAQALREASLALRRGELMPATEHFDPSDPYYWAPFVLVGDWR